MTKRGGRAGFEDFDRGDQEFFRDGFVFRRTKTNHDEANRNPFPWNALPAFRDVTSVAVEDLTGIGAEDLKHLTAIRRLLYLRFGERCVFRNDVNGGFPELADVTSLFMTPAKLSPEITGQLGRCFPNLKWNHPGSDEGTEWDDDRFAWLSGLGTVEKIFLHGKGTIGIGFADAIGSLGKLERFEFSGHFSLAPEVIPRLGEHRSLTQLAIDSPELFPHLGALAGLPNLTEIDLDLSGLRDLKLQSGIQGGSKKLKNLRVSGKRALTGAGFAGISRLPLVFVDASNTGLDDVGLVHFEGMRDLRILFLMGSKVTQAGVSTLQKKLPGCSIRK